ncbi:hypothetical protein [Chryseobacterium sp. SL1]|uniref:hypothetical protein n=1 Tax=Chryseobacterium sp. SL1 TaxID=2995159 RepID=UPI002274AA4A|nr:hypothetical protein [Chryseobacterium sp. SL1]MCY1660922.1 hypothetical protein [Chryseobacterium sp. SL1]
MPGKNLDFGVFEFSFYENDLSIQHQKLKREFEDYQNFLFNMKPRWKDARKKEFFTKHIRDCNEYAYSYLEHCKKLIHYLEEAREYTSD